MNLCIDIGNTRIKYLIYNIDAEVMYFVEDDFNISTIKGFFIDYPIDTCILSSTRIIDEEWLNLLKEKCEVIESSKIEIPLQLKYETPETLGRDRIVAAFAVKTMFPNEVSVIINAGTCITYDIIDDKGVFLGGNISPGLKMRLLAMHKFTDKLPLAEIQYNEELLGSNTVKALQNGGVRGALHEINSFLNEIIAIHEKVNIIVTGGDSNIFVRHLKFKIFAVPNLVLFGLNEILRYNADQ